MTRSTNPILAGLRDGLIVSCQPVTGGPLDRPDIVAAFALAAEHGGAKGLRIEGLANLRAVRAVTRLPIIGLVKRIDPATPIIITATLADVEGLAEAGADIVAFDATSRSGRPATVKALTEAAHAAGRLAMADLSSLTEAEAALAAGADILGTTLSGYTGGPVPETPDIDLVRACAALPRPVFAEGRYRSFDEVRAARAAGASAVVIGSAITRPEHATRWYADVMAEPCGPAGRPDAIPAAPTLAIDLGGTKLAAALVAGGRILDRREVPTDRTAGPDRWIDAAVALVADWSSCVAVGVAVTGAVRHGLWRALNPGTLPIPDDYPLVTEVARRLRLPVTARNDAQAAAWGEFRFGDAAGRDLIFVTVSTGIGGGIVNGGRLIEGRTGLAGHVGIMPIATPAGIRMLEEIASGSALAGRAAVQGGSRAVTAAAHRGESWAETMLDEAVAPLALALRRLQLELDPDRIVIGGGLGLAPGYLDRLRKHLADVPDLMRPRLTAATLGADAGLIGIADLAVTDHEEKNR